MFPNLAILKILTLTLNLNIISKYRLIINYIFVFKYVVVTIIQINCVICGKMNAFLEF